MQVDENIKSLDIIELWKHSQGVRKIEELVKYEFNNKKHPVDQIDKLANSIKEFGFYVPIVIDSNNIVIAGHGRIEACKKLNINEVPVVIMDNLSETQIKKLRILDNKIPEEGEWDTKNLTLELNQIGDLELSKSFEFLDLDLDLNDEGAPPPAGNGPPPEDEGEPKPETFFAHLDPQDKNEVEMALEKVKELYGEDEFLAETTSKANGKKLARICQLFVTQNIEI